MPAENLQAPDLDAAAQRETRSTEALNDVALSVGGNGKPLRPSAAH